MYKCIVCGRTYPNDYDITKPCKCGSKILVKINDKKGEPDISFDGRVENITVKTKGIFEININSIITEKTIVIKDESNIYYVKVPWKPNTGIE
ncbi:hypothetical protein J7J90_05125 [Candidatus Micrarchaeota archaeon]|nr:hypothetical protein [Candidatus Micrarchaeota archaeon]